MNPSPAYRKEVYSQVFNHMVRLLNKEMVESRQEFQDYQSKRKLNHSEIFEALQSGSIKLRDGLPKDLSHPNNLSNYFDMSALIEGQDVKLRNYSRPLEKSSNLVLIHHYTNTRTRFIWYFQKHVQKHTAVQRYLHHVYQAVTKETLTVDELRRVHARFTSIKF